MRTGEKERDLRTEDVAGLNTTLKSALSLQHLRHLLCPGGAVGREDICAALPHQHIQQQCPLNPEKQASSSRDITLRFRVAYH